MMKHFNKLQAPLHSIHVYPSLNHQEQRFKIWGWAHAQARTLWDLWSDEDFLSGSVRRSLDTVEAFDEWEELALFASHYFLLTASTKQVSNQRPERAQDLDPQLDASSQFNVLPYCPIGSGQRRYGALIPDTEISLGNHGGLGRQTRLASTSLYTTSQEITEPQFAFSPRDLPARMCHTVTTLSNGVCLLVGGRGSPTGVLQDCWVRQDDKWHAAHNLPIPRFRHGAVKVTVETSEECVVIYGGKTGEGECLSDWILWSRDASGWQTLEVEGPQPRARFGACFGSIGEASGVMFGGIGQDGAILEDFWTWELCRHSHGSVFLNLANHTDNLKSVSPLFRYLTRFGATMNQTPWGLVIVGGIAPRQIIPGDKEIMILHSTKLRTCLHGIKSWSRDLISAVGLGAEFPGPRPLLVGHGSFGVDPNRVLILGGGAVCFSFGTFWNEGTWLLERLDLRSQNTWAMIPESVQSGKDAPRILSQNINPGYGKTGDIAPIPRVHVHTSAQFQQILANAEPVVIEGSDIGSCTESWTKEYLTDAVGSDRMVGIRSSHNGQADHQQVVVHAAESENMNFQSKNFSYITKPFGMFLDEVFQGGRQYLRSVSAEQPSKLPADLVADFPGLKNDFQLPHQMALATDNAHSSPLRISGPVTMWLHYDVSSMLRGWLA